MQKLLFSATLTKNPQKIAMLQLNAPIFFTSSTTGQYVTPMTLKAYMTVCTLENKPLVLLHLLKTRNFTKVLCFTASVESTHRLYRLLELFGEVSVAEYSSTLPPAKRTAILADFRNGRTTMIICSDGMARGLDIDDVDNVVNYDVPVYVRTFIHRVGRTARAGREGHTYTLLTSPEVHHFKELLTKTDISTRTKKLPVEADALQPYIPKFTIVLERLKDVLEKEKLGHQSSMHRLGATAMNLPAKEDKEQVRVSMLRAGLVANLEHAIR